MGNGLETLFARGARETKRMLCYFVIQSAVTLIRNYQRYVLTSELSITIPPHDLPHDTARPTRLRHRNQADEVGILVSTNARSARWHSAHNHKDINKHNSIRHTKVYAAHATFIAPRNEPTGTAAEASGLTVFSSLLLDRRLRCDLLISMHSERRGEERTRGAWAIMSASIGS